MINESQKKIDDVVEFYRLVGKALLARQIADQARQAADIAEVDAVKKGKIAIPGVRMDDFLDDILQQTFCPQKMKKALNDWMDKGVNPFDSFSDPEKWEVDAKRREVDIEFRRNHGFSFGGEA